MASTVRGLLPALAVATLAACSGSDGTAPSPPPPQKLNVIMISPPSLQLVQGDSAKLIALGFDEQWKPMVPPNLAWTSSNTAVAEVSTSGMVRGIGVGNATRTAASEGLTASVSVVLSRAPARLVSLQTSISQDVLSNGESAVFSSNPCHARQGCP